MSTSTPTANSGYQSFVINGLGTTEYTIPEDGNYFFEGKYTLPNITQGNGESFVVTAVLRGAVPKYVGPAGAEGFRCSFLCSANDVISISLISFDPVDQGYNVIKGVISLGLGV